MIEFLDSKNFHRNGHPEEEYVVTWEAVIRGQNFVDAAVRARDELKGDDSTATCFSVMKAADKSVKVVDLNEESTMDNPSEPDETNQEEDQSDWRD